MIRLALPHPDAAELDMWLSIALGKDTSRRATWIMVEWRD